MPRKQICVTLKKDSQELLDNFLLNKKDKIKSKYIEEFIVNGILGSNYKDVIKLNYVEKRNIMDIIKSILQEQLILVDSNISLTYECAMELEQLIGSLLIAIRIEKNNTIHKNIGMLF